MYFKKAEQELIKTDKLKSFSVIGDPGCEGVGIVMMQTYASALTAAEDDDMILIAGDMVPAGNRHFYETAKNLTEAVAKKDVYTLKGNHDTGDYEKYCGLADYVIRGKDFSIAVLDNASRRFSDKGLELLGRELEEQEVKQVVIAFHIPVPNHFTGNAVSDEEFARLRKVYGPYKDKVSYLLCGHVHSRFEDEVDGIPFICTGGGGAFIEDVSEDIRACDVDHHIVRFFLKEGKLTHRVVDLEGIPYSREVQDKVLREEIEGALAGELMAHFKYLTYADRARRRGYEKTANLFEALAESEYRHARSFYNLIEKHTAFTSEADKYTAREKFEAENLYPMLSEYASGQGKILCSQAFSDAGEAEKVHARLLSEVSENIEGYPHDTIYVCPVCGYVMAGEQAPERCPVCGAPSKSFTKFSEAKNKD